MRQHSGDEDSQDDLEHADAADSPSPDASPPVPPDACLLTSHEQRCSEDDEGNAQREPGHVGFVLR
jgi:hypothetical protein